MSIPTGVRRALALSPLLLLSACEKVEAPEGLFDPPPRLQEAPQPAQTPTPMNQKPVADPGASIPESGGDISSPTLDGLLPIFTRLSLREPSQVGSPTDFTLLTPLPRLSPPRAIFQTPEGGEVLLSLGDKLGEGATRITAVTEAGVTLTSLEVGTGGNVTVESIEMRGTQPMPDPPPKVDSLGDTEEAATAQAEDPPAAEAPVAATPTPTPKRIINWGDHPASGSP